MKVERLLERMAGLVTAGRVRPESLLRLMDLIMERGLVGGEIDTEKTNALLKELNETLKAEDLLNI